MVETILKTSVDILPFIIRFCTRETLECAISIMSGFKQEHNKEKIRLCEDALKNI